MLVVIMKIACRAEKNSALPPDKKKNYKYIALIIALHVMQPVARLYGRFKHGLTPWRKRGTGVESIFLFVFGKHIFTYWSEVWRPEEEWLTRIEKNLMQKKTRVKRGGEYDNRELNVRMGMYSV